MRSKIHKQLKNFNQYTLWFSLVQLLARMFCLRPMFKTPISEIDWKKITVGICFVIGPQLLLFFIHTPHRLLFQRSIKHATEPVEQENHSNFL